MHNFVKSHGKSHVSQTVKEPLLDNGKIEVLFLYYAVFNVSILKTSCNRYSY